MMMIYPYPEKIVTLNSRSVKPRTDSLSRPRIGSLLLETEEDL